MRGRPGAGRWSQRDDNPDEQGGQGGSKVRRTAWLLPAELPGAPHGGFAYEFAPGPKQQATRGWRGRGMGMGGGTKGFLSENKPRKSPAGFEQRRRLM